MQIFLLWRESGQEAASRNMDEVVARLRARFAPLFDEPFKVTTRSFAAASLVRLSLPVRGWRPPFVQEDSESWALAGHYPLNARAALDDAARGIADEQLLPHLGRRLQADPAPLLDALAPPFSLLWSPKASGDVFAQNDGLGCAQLFEYRDDRIWALTNKIFALPALGVRLQAIPEDWAARLTLGWFPMTLTGYQDVVYLPPATQLHVTRDGVKRRSFEVLSSWVQPAPMARAESLELARTSLLDYISAVQPLWDEAKAGLSGGWDSRVIVAALRARNARFSLRVRGLPTRYDVVIAKQLAETAGLDLKVSSEGGLPLDSAEGCRESIRRALFWQAGYTVDDKYCSFLAERRFLNGGRVNVMGQYGELGKPRYADKIRAKSVQPEDYEEWLAKRMLRRMPPFLREDIGDRAREIVATTFRQAQGYGLTGLSALTFLYLFERCRRWASGSNSGQAGIVVTPFLNRDFIRVVFGFPGHDMTGHPFHRHITEVLAPDWADIPYTSDLKARAAEQSQAAAKQESDAPRHWRHPVDNKKYDVKLYWDQVGRAVILDGLNSEGAWTSMIDPELARAHWRKAPDRLAIALTLSALLDGEID